MLLLVLVFVLAAFGLLLVALVTGSASWAWASVAVSVAAAGALVFDWVQRRAAVSDGSRAATPVGAGARVGGAVEPPTTAIPPVGAQLGSRPNAQPAPQWGAPSGDGTARSDHHYAAVPSGSARQPSSAGPGSDPKDSDQSQSVTESEQGQASAAAGAAATPSGDAHPGAAAAAASPKQAVPGAGAPPAKPRDKSQAWKSALSGADPVMAKGAAGAAETPPPAGEAEVKAEVRADQATESADHPNAVAPTRPETGESGGKSADAKAAVTDSDQTTAIRPQSIADAPTEAIRVDKANQRGPSAPSDNPLFSKPTPPQARPGGPRSGIAGKAAAGAAAAGAAAAAAAAKPDVSTAKAEPAKPDAATSDAAKPDPAKPDAARPDAARPDQAKPDAARPDPARPDPASSAPTGTAAARPDAAAVKPDSVKPDSARSDAVKSDAVKSDAVKSDAAKPDSAAPDPAKNAPTQAGIQPDVPRSDAAAARTPSTPEGSEAATQAISAIRPPAEPGEERPDRAAAAIVAKLDDEVLVVDEQPRFHLAGCRTISGQETIPLPAREAVEYEFTPCAECTPVRILAARNRASSKS